MQVDATCDIVPMDGYECPNETITCNPGGRFDVEYIECTPLGCPVVLKNEDPVNGQLSFSGGFKPPGAASDYYAGNIGECFNEDGD